MLQYNNIKENVIFTAPPPRVIQNCVLFLDIDKQDVWRGLHTSTSILTLDFLANYDELCSRAQGISSYVYLLQAINTLCLLEVPMLLNKLDDTAGTQFPSPLDYHVAPVTAWSYRDYFPSQGFDSSIFRIEKEKGKYSISAWKHRLFSLHDVQRKKNTLTSENDCINLHLLYQSWRGT
jgi:hypothetical protein